MWHRWLLSTDKYALNTGGWAVGIWRRDKWIIKKISCSLKYLSSLTTIFSHRHIETTTSSSKQRFLDSLSVKSPNKHLSQEHPYNKITLNLPLRMFKDLVWGDYISTWPPEDERITEIMARVAIFIGVLSAPIPPRSISSLTVTIALWPTIIAINICKVRGLKSAWRSAHPSWRASQRSDWNVERGFGVWRWLEVGFLIPPYLPL